MDIIISIFVMSVPLIAFIFFIVCVSIAKKIHDGEDTFYITFWGALLFTIIITGLVFIH
ncbi:hypothetical protein [Chengkuizengella marina]|uniref:hypothetical protein n=1 Tax=Chengkuizengella marina TaxID=2507566 RepID=UPI001369BCFC|nr:hypothetical protein [Chengkuizengella marina]